MSSYSLKVGDSIKIFCLGLEDYIMGEVCKIQKDKITISSDCFDDFTIHKDIITKILNKK